MFCSNCGKEIKEGSAFCANCGNRVETEVKKVNTDFKKSVTEIRDKFNADVVLSKAKKHFTDFTVNYNSLFFKFAMAIMLAVGLSEHIVSIINMYLYDIIPTWSKYVYTIYEPAICLLLFGIFALIFTRLKRPETVKSSSVLVILWIAFTAFNILNFVIGIEMYKYILYSGVAINIIETVLIILIALLLFKNRPKYPFVLLISLLSYALTKMSLWSLKFNFLYYSINNEFSDFIKIIYPHTLGLVIFILASFLIRYLIGAKVSKWIIAVLAILMTVVNGFSSFDGFSIRNIIDFITKTALVFAIVFFAFSCGRNIQHEEYKEIKTKSSKKALIIGSISVVTVVVVSLAYLLTSAIICSNHINKGVRIWKEYIINGDVETDSQWDQAHNDISNYVCDGLVSAFVDDYDFYTTFKENAYTMERITNCYNAYFKGNFTEEVTEEYGKIVVDESWSNDDVLLGYYKKYVEMKPSLENVSAKVNVDVNNRKITVTVDNDNVTPLSSCTVNCHFTIGFIESGYYSNDIEYGRGERTFEIEDIPGSSEKTVEYSFDPDQYYDSYGSYIMSFLQESSASVTEIS